MGYENIESHGGGGAIKAQITNFVVSIDLMRLDLKP